MSDTPRVFGAAHRVSRRVLGDYKEVGRLIRHELAMGLAMQLVEESRIFRTWEDDRDTVGYGVEVVLVSRSAWATIERENAALRARAERAERERDEAVALLRGVRDSATSDIPLRLLDAMDAILSNVDGR